jgi:hypothetical protein
MARCAEQALARRELDDERTGNRDSLALAAGQFARIDVRIPRRQPDAIKHCQRHGTACRKFHIQ